MMCFNLNFCIYCGLKSAQPILACQPILEDQNDIIMVSTVALLLLFILVHKLYENYLIWDMQNFANMLTGATPASYNLITHLSKITRIKCTPSNTSISNLYAHCSFSVLYTHHSNARIWSLTLKSIHRHAHGCIHATHNSSQYIHQHPTIYNIYGMDIITLLLNHRYQKPTWRVYQTLYICIMYSAIHQNSMHFSF